MIIMIMICLWWWCPGINFAIERFGSTGSLVHIQLQTSMTQFCSNSWLVQNGMSIFGTVSAKFGWNLDFQIQFADKLFAWEIHLDDMRNTICRQIICMALQTDGLKLYLSQVHQIGFQLLEWEYVSISFMVFRVFWSLPESLGVIHILRNHFLGFG